MIDCGHVFCVQCLQDFYHNAILEGDLISVRCLAPDCAKKRAEKQVSKSKRGRKAKVQLSPSELLQIPLDQESVTRFVKLKYKTELESDQNTIYCPRKWCQGAARSKKHRKPEGVEENDTSDESESEEEGAEKGKKKDYVSGKDLLSICEDCAYAFCSRCLQGWHGEFIACAPPRKTEDLSEEEKASMRYMRLHTTPCPTCAAPAQKTHGCNHMVCFKCASHFCYLCSAWLMPSNPYQHFNAERTPCFQRLWELEAGDGDDVGIDYAGGRNLVNPEDQIHLEEALAEEVFVVEEPGEEEEDEPPVERQEVEREGPLVLRINQPRPPRPAAPAVPDAPHQNPPRRNHPHGAGFAARRRERGQEALRNAAAQEAANQAWVQMFVQMAMNDEEDQLESDDEVDDMAFEIRDR